MDDPLSAEKFDDDLLRQSAEGEPSESEASNSIDTRADDADFGSSDDGSFTGDELEQAYLRALEAVEFPESEIPEHDDDLESTPQVDDSSGVRALEIVDEVPIAAEAVEESALSSGMPEQVATIPLSASQGSKKFEPAVSEEARISPTQVIEAVLFVGGPPLTAKKLAGLLRGSTDAETIERMIDELNQDYGAQNRPYEIRLGDGGYRLELRPDYERLRLRVYGGGPREVRLSQDLLEVLALVAYKQPISASEIEAVGKKNAESLLRQLLRRELLALRRNEENPKEVRYYTTARFLSLFGLGSLDELPQPEDVDLK